MINDQRNNMPDIVRELKMIRGTIQWARQYLNANPVTLGGLLRSDPDVTIWTHATSPPPVDQDSMALLKVQKGLYTVALGDFCLTGDGDIYVCTDATPGALVWQLLIGSSGITVNWGDIGGSLGDQVDLKDQLDRALLETFLIACSDESSDLATGTAVVTFRMPFDFTLLEVRASVTDAPVGADLVVDVNQGGVSVLSTLLSIDDGEKSSQTAAVPPVISDEDLFDDAEITIDIDQVGSSTPGTGLKVALSGRRA